MKEGVGRAAEAREDRERERERGERNAGRNGGQRGERRPEEDEAGPHVRRRADQEDRQEWEGVGV
jgi:hypothetical protein